ncbi:DUF2971 domain-containing protein [Priestia aryabhattai]|uniref:DUF2971 domain-containing protein n=1 Tax=Priestia aryabhattai TaxID=412384 RepID=UPI003D2830D1
MIDLKIIKDVEKLEKLLDEIPYNIEKVIENLDLNAKERTLYHYTSIYGLEGILKNSEFWVSHSAFLNDKTELEYTYKLCQEIIDEMVGENQKLHELASDIFQSGIEKSRDTELYILSMTTNGDSNLLWSNYSHNDGYSLALKYPDIVKTFAKEREVTEVVPVPADVIYDREKQKQLLEAPIRALLQFMHFNASPDVWAEGIDNRFRELFTAINIYSAFFKDECFKQEEEVRIVFMSRDITNKLKQDGFRISNGAFIPYLKAPFHSKKEVIQSITIGPKNHMDIAKEGLSKLLKHYGYDHISDGNVEKSKIPYRY